MSYNNTIACQKVKRKHRTLKTAVTDNHLGVRNIHKLFCLPYFINTYRAVCPKSWLKWLYQMVACLENYGNYIFLLVFSLTHTPTSTYSIEAQTQYNLKNGEELAKCLLEARWVVALYRVLVLYNINLA